MEARPMEARNTTPPPLYSTASRPANRTRLEHGPPQQWRQRGSTGCPPVHFFPHAMPTGQEKEKRGRGGPNRPTKPSKGSTTASACWHLPRPLTLPPSARPLLHFCPQAFFSLSFPTIAPYETRGYTNERCVRGLQLQHAAHLVR